MTDFRASDEVTAIGHQRLEVEEHCVACSVLLSGPATVLS